MTLAFRSLLPAWAGVLLLIFNLPSQAQEPAGSLWVRVVAVSASGARAKDKAPALDPALKLFSAELTKLPYASYRALSHPKPIKRLSASASGHWKLPFTFESAVKGELRGGSLVLSMNITRAARPPKTQREQVASMTVKLKEGAHYLVKCVKGAPPGDMLLIVTASKRPLSGGAR